MALLLDGDRVSGEDIRTQNVTACVAIANIVRTSLGPVGLDKMLVDQIGDATITNDGATILQMLEVDHPAAKVLVELSARQDKEVGDGTTSVVLLAAELLKRAHELVKQKIHPTTVISGIRLAMREAVKFIKSNMVFDIADLGEEVIINAAKTSMSSKIIGADDDFFSKLVVSAAMAVEKTMSDGRKKYFIDNVNIIKCPGQSSTQSHLVDGFALQMMRSAQGMPLTVKNAKIALLGFDLRQFRLQQGVQVLVKDVNEMEKIKEKEKDITRDRIMKLINAGANVILTSGGIDDLNAKYLVEHGVMGLRRVPVKDLNRIATATGGTLLPNLADLEGQESVDPECLGTAADVSEVTLSDQQFVYIKGATHSGASTIVLRGANGFMLDEIERSVHDALCVVKRVLESRKVVAGGGAVEAAVSVHLDTFATTLGSREQLAIQQFAEALLVIPRTLAVNAAKDSPELVARLCALHYKSQTQQDQVGLKNMGLDLVEGVVVDSVARGVLEPALSKVKSLRFATEAATTILRIDDYIKLNAKEQQQQ